MTHTGQMPPTRAPTGTGAAPRGPSLLERGRELAALDELIGTVAGGSSAVGVLEGPAGIGKSRLLGEARERAAGRGMMVLSAVATELERGYGFGVAAQLFEPIACNDPEFLSGGAEAARVVVDRGYHGQEGDERGDHSFASLNGLYWLAARVCEPQPLVLAVDDLQWCDVPSLRFLAYLRTRLESLPILLLCSVRSGVPGPGAEVQEAIVAGPGTVRLRPRALSERAATEVIARELRADPDPAFVAACHGATGGNPLLLDELVRVLDSEGVRPDHASIAVLKDLGPSSVPRTVLLRLHRLGPDATAVAQALSVLGDGADLAVLAALADIDIGRAGEATAALTAAGIVRPEPPLGFVHPVVGEAIRRDVLPGRRELLHARAAELLSGAGAAPERVARHLVRAPATGARWAVDQLVRAALEDARKGATEEAASYLRRALEEPPPADERAEILLALGGVELLGDGGAAAVHLRAAYDLLTDPGQRADAAGLLARALLFTGRGEEAVGILREAAAALPDRLRGLRDSLAAYELFCAFFFGIGDGDARARIKAYRAEPVEAGPGACMLAAIAAHAWMYDCGPSGAVSELALASLSSGELIAADSGWAAAFPATVLTLADRQEAELWWERITVEAHRRGSLLQITSVGLSRSRALRRRGDLAEAEQCLATCRGALREWGHRERMAEIFCDAHTASLERERGDLVGARRALGPSPDAGRDDEGARLWYGSELELLVAEGAYEQAVTRADEYALLFDGSVRNPADVPWRSLKAVALDHLGRHDEALELLWDELDLARAWGAPGAVARTLRTLGTVERREGIEHLEEAVAVVAGSPARLEHAHALAALGASHRRWHLPTAARAPLREALELATAFGAELLARRARAELHAAGGRPRRTALTGVGSLTASERRAAQLAAEGRTNREIGEVLFVTPKTVAMHLSNTYRKLGVASRRELATALSARDD